LRRFQNIVLEADSILDSTARVPPPGLSLNGATALRSARMEVPIGNAEIRRVFERAEPGSRKAHKRELMACALDAFEAGGIAATTIEDIRARAGSSIGSIYHHFGNKD